MKEGIQHLEALQKLSLVDVSKMGAEAINELGKLTELRKLGIIKLRSDDGRWILFEGIEKMSHLKSVCNYNE